MESYNRKVVNTVKFSFNDIPKFEDNNKFNNNNNINKSKKSISEIKPKLIKPLKSTHNIIHNKNSKILLDSTKKSESLKNNQENIYKKANLKSSSFPFKKIKSSKSLKPIVDLNRKNDNIKNYSISDNKISVKKNNYNSSELNEEKLNKLFSRKSLDSLNNELYNKKINTSSHLKEISANLININLNSVEKNENTINNENRLSTITIRVKQLEQQLSITMKELQEKNNIIYELKKELKEKNLLLKSSSDEKISLLQQKFQKSQEKLEIAYDYLKRYNITIDEDNKSEIFSLIIDDINNNNTEKFIHKFPYDFDQFSKQIKFLNHLSGN
ncbi:hypothetical protein PIROE2DRAFT_14172 [Piromyces sp. E2]|nr:hypothetical protein PIROE2DRAFT_14172 [Piromyces sp. E2]|eukprot:OUM60142.1 hypothetical protein PIROE2DRAFT_14172 [Piromyces sp. E2]